MGLIGIVLSFSLLFGVGTAIKLKTTMDHRQSENRKEKKKTFGYDLSVTFVRIKM